MPESTRSLQFSVTPLGAGDLVDRAVRFYRANFWTLVLIAAPPVVVGTVISVGWTALGREIFSVGSYQDQFEKTFYYLFVWFGNVVIWLAETAAALVVMGGAARNFVRHLLFGEAITFKETYGNAWRRLPGLIAAALIITALLGFAGFVLFYVGLLVGLLAIGLAVYSFSFSPFISFVVSLALGLATVFGTGWLFFLLASRLAYAPQVMLVEGLGVFPAIGRSAALASGNVKRLAALFLFSIVAAYSALLLLYVPLAWYAWASGVEFLAFDIDAIPAWYEIANQVISQTSLILLMPVWMIGLCLLYVDERVRHEGYDIELLAARRLGEIPAVPTDFINPLQPALKNQPDAPPTTQPKRNSSLSPLGLE
jgi:hypothetical protein